MKRALVLGGGGVIGIAWETGLIAGLREGGIDLREADIIVGTSAGSFVGTQLAAGQALEVEASEDGQESNDSNTPNIEDMVDMQSLMAVFQVWSSVESMDQATMQRIGELALKAKTMPAEAWIEATGANTGVDDWPEKDLRITTVDAGTGEFIVQTRQSGVPLHHAVAASCSVPGMAPTIEIDGRRLMDGGVRSGTNADILLPDEPTSTLVIAPIGRHTPVFGPLMQRALEQELEVLREQAPAQAILPSAEEVEQFGPNLMDVSKAAQARQMGYAKARQLLEQGAISW